MPNQTNNGEAQNVFIVGSSTDGYSGEVTVTNFPAIQPVSGNVTGSTSAPTTTSASYVVIPEMTLTITTQGGSIVVGFNGSFNVRDGDDFTIGIHQDGSLVGKEQRLAFFGGTLLGLTPASMTSYPAIISARIATPSAASHTYDVRWKVAAGTARAITTLRQMTVTEII